MPEGVRLLVHRVEPADLRKPRLAALGQREAHALLHDVDAARERGHEAVGRALVEEAELQRVAAREVEPHGIVAVAHPGVFRGVDPLQQLVGRRARHTAQAGPFAQRAVREPEREALAAQHRVVAVAQRVVDPVGHLDRKAKPAVGRRDFDGFRLRRTAQKQCAATDNSLFISLKFR